MLNPKQFNTDIKWSWLTVSCLSLLTGVIYLTTTNLTGPAQTAQQSIQDQAN